MKKLAIIGASYLQLPLIKKAKKMGLETHVFAWAANDPGEDEADFFYPISIVEKDMILEKCREIGIDGIATIASDLAVITVNYVAEKMGLVGNSMQCTEVSTNKYLMRQCFLKNGDPSPKSIPVKSANELEGEALCYPVIVKPIDRSGSRGITKLESADGLGKAVQVAIEQGFEKTALIEEYASGQEYSVEYISWEGKHHFLALTHKYTTGAPGFVETGHLEPAPVNEETLAKVKKTVSHALDSLGIRYGASHSELKIDRDGTIRLIEIGGRMGGDFIGSTLVEMSTGVDFLRAVIEVSLGIEPTVMPTRKPVGVEAIRFVFAKEDIIVLERLKKEHPEYLISYDVEKEPSGVVTDSSNRFGYYIMSAPTYNDIQDYLPK